MRKLAVAGIVAASAVGGAAVAWAALGGDITGNLVSGGLATGSGTPCQATDIDFAFSSPTWDSSGQQFIINGMTYSGFDSDCVTATAPLKYAVVRISNGNTLVTGTVTPTGTSGSATFSTPLDAANTSDYKINYLVVG